MHLHEFLKNKCNPLCKYSHYFINENEANLKFYVILSLWKNGIDARPEVAIEKGRVDIAFLANDEIVLIETKSKIFDTFEQMFNYLLCGDYIFEIAPYNDKNLESTKYLTWTLNNLKNSFYQVFYRHLSHILENNLLEKFSEIASFNIGRYLINQKNGDIFEIRPAIKNSIPNILKCDTTHLKRKLKSHISDKNNKTDNRIIHDYTMGVVGEYFLKLGYNVAFEQKLKSLKEEYIDFNWTHPFANPDKIHFGKKIEKIPRIDILVWKGNERIGIEVKTNKSISKAYEQISIYKKAMEINKLYLAIPDFPISSKNTILKAKKLCEMADIELLLVDLEQHKVNFGKQMKQTNLFDFM
ncbi:hypothetical protein JH146_0647 [Methanocaldococcus bathoardescens]|uniref:Restriction endonuclease n=1 Tax=Methanocaldococcus bathoardescens TaxID=1301915 RepID=A0A076LBF4_9EURY|nr:hypothetical protein [Methanocaldococcus bathoardescens]AIJ05496.1 hypothetical protein JH146_0647 [Methanocaldococcus bathoardescens]